MQSNWLLQPAVQRRFLVAIVSPNYRKGRHNPFLEEPCQRDLTIFNCLLLSQPFAVGKGAGLTAAWASAVDEINKQCDPQTGEHIFVPPIAVKTVRDRFNQAMKIIAKIENGIPFRSGTDDEESPNDLQVMLEDRYSQEKGYDSSTADVKLGALAKKKKDRDAAKQIQMAAIGQFDAFALSDIKSVEDDSPEDSGETKKRQSTMSASTGSLKELMEERLIERKKSSVARNELAERSFQEQAKQRELAEKALEVQRRLADRQIQQADR